MLGTIDKVVDNFLYLNLNVDPYKVQNLLNLYVLINDNNKNYIGEIISIDKNIATILLLGEYNNNELFYGIIQKPSLTSAVNIINSNFINKLLSFPNDVSINIAFSPYYDNVPIPACVSSLFGSHMAVIGSSGSGKSNSFTRIVQNLMSNIKNKDNVNFVIFDSYGEYKTAFEYLNDSTDLGFKLYTSNINSSDELLNIPLWFLDIDDYALLLEITQKNQLTIIEKALRNVHIFKNNNENVDAIKNSILSTALLDILLSGKPAAQIRDLITSALSKFNTKDLNLETIISQPGYSRTLRQCLIIDNNNKINAIELLTEFLQKFEFENTNTALPDGSYPYTLEDFAEALDFALIEEGIWKSTKIFDNINILKIRLASLISSEKSKYFDVKDYIDKED